MTPKLSNARKSQNVKTQEWVFKRRKMSPGERGGVAKNFKRASRAIFMKILPLPTKTFIDPPLIKYV